MGHGRRERLRQLQFGTAVGLDQRVDVVGKRCVTVESFTDRPQRVARPGRCTRWPASRAPTVSELGRANHGGGGRSAPTIRHNVAGTDEQHQHDRRQDEHDHQTSTGIDLREGEYVSLNCPGMTTAMASGCSLPGRELEPIEHTLPERLFVACHEQSFDVNLESNICFTNECLTWVTNAVYAIGMSEQLDRPPTWHPRHDRNQHARAWISAQRARDRRGRRSHFPVDGAQPSGVAAADGLPQA